MEPLRTDLNLDQKEPGPHACQLRHGAGGGRARVCGHGFPPNARKNSKYPKGTPLGPIFLYLNPLTFHTLSNVGLKRFYIFLFPLVNELGQLSI